MRHTKAKRPFVLYYNSPIDPDPNVPCKTMFKSPINALVEAWVNHLHDGRSFSIKRLNGKRVFDEEELREAFNRLSRLEHEHPQNRMREWAAKVIKEMGKEV